MVSSLSGLWRPLFRLASGAQIAPVCCRDLDRRNAVKRANFLGDLDGGDNCCLRVDNCWIRFQTAFEQAKRHSTSAENFDVDVRRTGHLLKEARTSFEYRRGTGQTGARQPRSKHRVARGFGGCDPFPFRKNSHARLGQRNMVVDG